MKKQDLDFPEIKENLKTFLNSQTEFSDYDLTMSGMDQIINLLAYGIHYDSIQSNFSLNEMFLESAKLRKNIVSRAKQLSYTPKSAVSAKLIANIIIEENIGIPLPNTLFLPKGTKFIAKSKDFKDISFVTTQLYVAYKTNSIWTFSNVELYEGSYNAVYSQYNELGIEIPNENIDERFIEVFVKETSNALTNTTYNRVKNILDVDSNSRVFYLEENSNERYTIKFGDGVLGKRVLDGTEVLITYVQNHASNGNGHSDLSFSKTSVSTDMINKGKVRIITILKSSGGADKETTESIKINAPKYFSTQRIILNDSDAKSIIPKLFSDIKSVNVWSGKNTNVFGKTFISLNPYEDNLTEERINEILLELEKERFVILTKLEYKKPTYIDLGVKIHVYFKSSTSITTIKDALYEKIIEYSKNNIEDFMKNFISSRFISTINLESQLDYDYDIQIKYRLPVILNSLQKYSFSFQNEISKIESSSFIWEGELSIIKNDLNVLNIYKLSTNEKIRSIGAVDLITGELAFDLLNIQYSENNEITFTATPELESIFGVNNNILRILEKDIDLTYEIKN